MFIYLLLEYIKRVYLLYNECTWAILVWNAGGLHLLIVICVYAFQNSISIYLSLSISHSLSLYHYIFPKISFPHLPSTFIAFNFEKEDVLAVVGQQGGTLIVEILHEKSMSFVKQFILNNALRLIISDSTCIKFVNAL